MAQFVTRGTALITGAFTGIGAIYAHRLARRGYDLVLVAPTSGRLEPLADWLRRETGRSVETLAADLTQPAGLAETEERLRTDLSLTMLVSNASAGAPAPRISPGLGHVADLIALNVGVPARLAYAAAERFASRGEGAIVTVAPVAPATPAALPGTEDGGRAYLLELIRALAVEGQDHGVRVQLVLPDPAAGAFWDLAGDALDQLAQEMLLLAELMVDDALADFDQHRFIASPSVPRIGDWSRFKDRATRAPFARFARGPLVELA